MTVSLLEGIVVLVSLVLLSNVLSHFLTFIPISLLQIAIGLFLALVFKVEIPLKTDWFMLLFIAPLLFNDGRKFPQRELWALRGPIIANAIFLVLVTSLLGGLIIHQLIPALPLAGAIALAAILSPTDPVAVQSISSQAKLPEKVLHLVSGESLVNDASGLIAFKYGVAATVTGTFIWQHALMDFGYIAIVGALIGIVGGVFFHLLQRWLLDQGITDVVLHTILQLVIPFLIYLIAEEGGHASGVIAVVAAGILLNLLTPDSVNYLPELRIVSERTWDLFVYVLNGIVFLILGIELPIAMTQTIQNPQDPTLIAIMDVFLVWLTMFGLRVLWTLGNMFITYWRDKKVRPNLMTAVLSGLSGVRGAITMAGVLSVPYTLANGTAFPERALMLFVAAGVIILSLLMAVVFLPLLTRRQVAISTRGSEASQDLTGQPTTTQSTEHNHVSESQARIYTMQMAVQRLESARRPENQRAAYDLISEYQHLIRQLQVSSRPSEKLVPFLADELALRQIGLNGERAVIDAAWAAQEISASTYQLFNRHLAARGHLLAVLDQQVEGLHPFQRFQRITGDFAKWYDKWLLRRLRRPEYGEALALQKEAAKGGIKALSAYLKRDEARKHHYNRQLIYQIIVSYRNQIEKLKQLGREKVKKASPRQQYDQQMRRLRLQALAGERQGIQQLLEQKAIPWQMAAKLRQYVNYSENALFIGEDLD